MSESSVSGPNLSRSKMWFVAFLFVYALACRLAPYVLGVSIDPSTTWYPWNFSPLLALSVFSGACLADRRLSFGLPLAVMVISDFGIWALTGDREFAFPASQPLIYACFAATIGLGMLLRKRPHMVWALPTGYLAEAMFFLVTNFAVWWFGEGQSYPLTAAGLATCYAMAIPFLGRSILSTTVYTLVLFSPQGLRLAGVDPVNWTGRAVAVPVRKR
jgi:hypothetical protein